MRLEVYVRLFCTACHAWPITPQKRARERKGTELTFLRLDANRFRSIRTFRLSTFFVTLPCHLYFGQPPHASTGTRGYSSAKAYNATSCQFFRVSLSLSPLSLPANPSRSWVFLFCFKSLLRSVSRAPSNSIAYSISLGLVVATSAWRTPVTLLGTADVINTQ